MEFKQLANSNYLSQEPICLGGGASLDLRKKCPELTVLTFVNVLRFNVGLKRKKKGISLPKRKENVFEFWPECWKTKHCPPSPQALQLVINFSPLFRQLISP